MKNIVIAGIVAGAVILGIVGVLIGTGSPQNIQQSPSIKTTTPSQPTESSEKYCNPSYPDVCIPAWPPDLDCPDIPYRNFKVIYPDQHKFDQDKDGIGCEE